jgi:hypothetical protein
MYGMARSPVFPNGTVRQKISLDNLKRNEYIKLKAPDTKKGN